MRTLIAAAMLVSFLLPHLSLADPLHKSGKRGEWRHAESGWVFAAQIAGLERVASPYTIDGNNDVGAEYAAGEASARRTAFVDIFLRDSAATGATLVGAKATLIKAGGVSQRLTETPFEIPGKPDLKGVKLVVSPKEGTDRLLLYFFTAPGWVVSVRATAPADTAKPADSMDGFVRALPWDTLGAFDDNMHGGGS
jgi:hypothetical protein